MNDKQSNSPQLDVYLFYGASNSQSQWCFGFDCDNPFEIITKLNNFPSEFPKVEVDKNPYRWRDGNGNQYDVIMLLGPNKEYPFEERKRLSRQAIEDITSKEVKLHEI